MKNVLAIISLLWRLLLFGQCTSVYSLIIPKQQRFSNRCQRSSECPCFSLSSQQKNDDETKPKKQPLKSRSPKSRTNAPRISRPFQGTKVKTNTKAGNDHNRKRRILSSEERKRNVENFFHRFSDKEEINKWMKDKVEQQQQQQQQQQKTGGFEGNTPFPKAWSSRDETDFIRVLRDVGAYPALELFVGHFARKNVFVFTAAISAMANSRDGNIRTRGLRLLDKMDEAEVLPSSFTFEALFKSVDGPEAAKELMLRLQVYKDRTSFSEESFNQAIMACSRCIPGRRPTNKSWQFALDFAHNLRRAGLRPNLKTYTSLLNVCAQTGQVRIAMSLFREIEGNPDLDPSDRVYGSLLNVCAQAGDYRLANNVLTAMKESGNPMNLFHCSAFLKALSRNGQVEMSLQVLNMITGSAASNVDKLNVVDDFEMTEFPTIAPDLVALNTILKCCSQAGDFPAARKLVDRMKDGGFKTASSSETIYPDEISYSLLLSSCSDPLAAKGILKEMQLSRRHRVGVVRPSSITYARAITVCRRAEVPDVDTACFFLASARKDGVVPTVFMFSAAIWTAEGRGNFSMSKEFLDNMRSEGIAPNSICYTGVISAAARNGQVFEAIELCKEMKRQGCLPTFATYNALALSVRNSQSTDKASTLESIVDTLKTADRRVEIGGPVMEALIKEYCRKGAYDGARRIFDMIEGPCNGQCLRAMLLACATASSGPQWEEAIAILHSSDITSSAIGPGEMDQVALSNAMIACAEADRWEEGLNLLQLYGVRTPRRSSAISVVALNAVMSACGRKGRADIAFNTLNDMERYGVKPDGRSYRSVIVACNQAEHQKRRHERDSFTRSVAESNNEPAFQWWEACIALLRRMREEGLQPDIQTFSSCISACEAAGEWQRALAILQSMIDTFSDGEETKFLNLFCFNAAISSCEKGGAWVEALEIYERMISYGGSLKPNFVTLSSLVLALVNAGQKELADSKYLEGMTTYIVNPWRTTKGASGIAIKAMDLHTFNSAMASCAVRSFLDSLLKGGNDIPIEDDFVIIVGKGKRSTEDPVLLPTVQKVLNQEYGINNAEVEAQNKGRLVIKAENLRALIAGRSW